MSLTEIIDYLKANAAEREIELRPGVNENLIREVEETYSVILPDDVKQFYRFCNGFDTYDWMFNLIKMEDMIGEKIKYKEERLPLAEYLIYSETWYLEVNPDNANDYHIAIPEMQGTGILTRSLATFIERFLNGGLHDEGGLLSWVEEL